MLLYQMCFNAFDKAADLDVLDHPILNLIYYLVSLFIIFLYYGVFCHTPYCCSLFCCSSYHFYIRSILGSYMVYLALNSVESSDIPYLNFV